MKKELIFSLISTSILLFAFLNYKFFHLEYALVGFFHELIILPCIISQPILFYLSLKNFLKINFKMDTSFFVMVILFLTMISIFVSFII